MNRSPACPAPPTVLCADDDPLVRRGIERLLTSAGYSVTLAPDGLQAWNALRTGHFDLLITDGQMPRLSGPQLVRRIRRARLHLPILGISAALDLAAALNTRTRRDCAFIAKPFTPAEFLETIQRLCPAPLTPPSTD
jgi:CheY-like chemotaxis protein